MDSEAYLFAFIKDAMKTVKCENLFLVLNKARKKDTPDTAVQFYNQGLDICKANYLPTINES